MTVTMYDSIELGNLPTDEDAYAGYVDGDWPTFNELKTLFPYAKLLSIAVHADADADCLDMESGAASVEDAPSWWQRQRTRGLHLPVLYTEASQLSALENAMHESGVSRTEYRLWSAHYTVEHFCGPGTCGYGLSPANGTQWTEAALSRNLDQSTLEDSFFADAKPYEPVEIRHGFWRQVADGTESLTEWAHKRHQLARIVAHHTLRTDSPINARNRKRFEDYRHAKGSTGAAMPKGLVFYSFHK